MNISSSQESNFKKGRFQLVALGASLAALSAAIIMWQGGVIGFFQAIAERGDVLAVVVLVGAIAVLFVMLQRFGVAIESGDEVSTSNPSS